MSEWVNETTVETGLRAERYAFQILPGWCVVIFRPVVNAKDTKATPFSWYLREPKLFQICNHSKDPTLTLKEAKQWALAEFRAAIMELYTVSPQIIMTLSCAYCCAGIQGNFSIHRDGFSEGPEVPLCDECGSETGPSTDEIWSRISQVPT